MPEGDTIWRVAARLRPALVGQPLRRFEAARLTGPRPSAGTVIEAVDAVGKHLLIRFADGVVVQTHLRMTGSWHLYRVGERWRRPSHLARLCIETDEWVAVCFAAPIVRSSRVGASPQPGEGTASRAMPHSVTHLGPDLTSPSPDLDAVLARLAALDPQRQLVDVLLDQRVAAGIGNVYKSELLWLHRLAPRLPLGALPEAGRRQLYAHAHRLLRANLGTAKRITAPEVPGGLAVYRRRGRGCPRCHTPIVRQLLGEQPRSTYWCPRCQAPPDLTAR